MTLKPVQVVYDRVYASMRRQAHRPRRMFHQSLYLWRSLRSAPYRISGAPDGLPIPSSRLLFTVAGTPSVTWFLHSGQVAAESIVSSLKSNGIRLRDFDSILDFGCGCGRVIRHFNGLKQTRLCGTDYNQELIRWCRRNLRFAEFETNHLNPPLNYGEGKFDFVYALSVFTHLPANLQLLWRDEILRALKPGGFFLMTTHGEHYLRELTPEEQDAFQDGQLVVRGGNTAGSNFCAAYHPLVFVRREFGRGFRIRDFIPEGASGNPYQDVFLLEKT
ncbi:MAG: methyltransferase domain-containing protein [Candidatus Bathyarchaeia archaeon]